VRKEHFDNGLLQFFLLVFPCLFEVSFSFSLLDEAHEDKQCNSTNKFETISLISTVNAMIVWKQIKSLLCFKLSLHYHKSTTSNHEHIRKKDSYNKKSLLQQKKEMLHIPYSSALMFLSLNFLSTICTC